MHKFVIFSPSYSENNGGAVTLHHLCDLINKIGYECYLYPAFDNFELNKNNYKNTLYSFLKKMVRQPLRIFKTSNRFTTPVLYDFPGRHKIEDMVVIYPEIVFGNPLQAKNVVRWLLHNPGFFSKKIYYGSNEIYFKYSNQYSDFNYLNSMTSKNILYIFTYLKNYYNNENIHLDRFGVAYCVRKGALSEIPLDISQAILIDGMKHKEISKIFKRVKYFISFDLNTAFSRFAAICGCISIVVPVKGVRKETWQPDKTKRYGISYGFEKDEISEAISSIEKLNKELEIEEYESINSVKNFIYEVESFFKKNFDS